MKKIITAIIFSVFLSTSASAEVGVNIGISGSLGIAAATGQETHTDGSKTGSATTSDKESEIAALGYQSIFIEKTLGERFAIGIDYVPSAISSETAETNKKDRTTTATPTDRTNTIKVDFEDLTTYYVSMDVTDNLYLKAGMATVDLITKENLETGASYGNTDMDAVVLGFGWNKTFDNSIFVRLESTYMNFDGVSLTSGENTVSLKNLDTMTGKLSIGKSF